MHRPKQPYCHRRSIRLRGYDYRQSGVYFVTICSYQKTNLFGAIVDGDMALSPLGEIARDEWRHIARARSNVERTVADEIDRQRHIARARSNVELDHYVIMPNHLHGLFIITDSLERDFGLSAKTPHSKQSRRLPAGSLGAIISQYKAAVSRRAWSGLMGRSQRIWQRNYYDHIVRDEQSLSAIRKYIVENPARWHDDSLYVA